MKQSKATLCPGTSRVVDVNSQFSDVKTRNGSESRRKWKRRQIEIVNRMAESENIKSGGSFTDGQK
jgi:hypothetical protein